MGCRGLMENFEHSGSGLAEWSFGGAGGMPFMHRGDLVHCDCQKKRVNARRLLYDWITDHHTLSSPEGENGSINNDRPHNLRELFKRRNG